LLGFHLLLADDLADDLRHEAGVLRLLVHRGNVLIQRLALLVKRQDAADIALQRVAIDGAGDDLRHWQSSPAVAVPGPAAAVVPAPGFRARRVQPPSAPTSARIQVFD